LKTNKATIFQKNSLKLLLILYSCNQCGNSCQVF